MAGSTCIQALGLKGFQPRKPLQSMSPPPSLLGAGQGEGREARSGSPRNTNRRNPELPPAHTRTHPPGSTVNGPTCAHLPAQGHWHTDSCRSHRKPDRHKVTLCRRQWDHKVTKAKTLTGDTQTPPTAYGTQFWRQTIVNKAWLRSPLQGGDSWPLSRLLSILGSPPGCVPQPSQAWPGVRAVGGGDPDIRTTCHTLTCLCTGACGGQQQVPSRDSLDLWLLWKTPHSWTLPRAVPWLGGAGRGCLYPGGGTDPEEGPAALAL